MKTVSQERNRDLTINTTEDWGSKHMDFDVISTATNHFSELNKLGKGGFGIVYKVKRNEYVDTNYIFYS